MVEGHGPDSAAKAHPGVQEDGARMPRPLVCPPFTPGLLRRQLVADSAVRWAFRLLLAVGLFLAMLDLGSGLSQNVGWVLFLLMLLSGWIVHQRGTARAAQALPHITGLVESDDEAAEAVLAEALRRRPLTRSLRLLLYHRLALWRHRRQRFDESAVICQAVLAEPAGAARPVRPHLLLMLGEARLQAGDFWGTWLALQQLHTLGLNLVEGLQRLALQTRYEVGAGYDAAALHGLAHKIAMVELMPAPQCGVVHAVLAVAARRARHTARAAWRWRRAELLCTPEQLRRIETQMAVSTAPGGTDAATVAVPGIGAEPAEGVAGA